MEKFIITAPHAFCGPTFNEQYVECDDISGKAARYLSAALQQGHANCTKSVTTFVNESIVRKTCDLNRLVCRNDTTFREPIRREFSSEPSSKVIDVHSFPDILHAWQGSDINTKVAEVVVLDDFHRTGVRHFVDYLQSRGIDAHYLAGANNDIMEEFHGILIEFADRLSDNRLAEITSILADALCRHREMWK